MREAKAKDGHSGNPDGPGIRLYVVERVHIGARDRGRRTTHLFAGIAVSDIRSHWGHDRALAWPNLAADARAMARHDCFRELPERALFGAELCGYANG